MTSHSLSEHAERTIREIKKRDARGMFLPRHAEKVCRVIEDADDPISIGDAAAREFAEEIVKRTNGKRTAEAFGGPHRDDVIVDGTIRVEVKTALFATSSKLNIYDAATNRGYLPGSFDYIAIKPTGCERVGRSDLEGEWFIMSASQFPMSPHPGCAGVFKKKLTLLDILPFHNNWDLDGTVARFPDQGLLF